MSSLMLWLLVKVSVAMPAVSLIAGGHQHTCALFADGGMSCWGGLTTAQATGREEVPASLLVPAPVPELGGIRWATAGGKTQRAVAVGDTVYTWSASDSPAAESWRFSGLRQVEHGMAHTCVLDDAGVGCWGYNARGQLGDGTTEARDAPVRVPGQDDAVQIATGLYSTCAAHDDGSVWCWGASGPEGTRAAMDPTRVEGLPEITQVTAGSAHICALSTVGTLHCWGNNGRGQLGNNTSTHSLAPQLLLVNRDFIQIAAGMDHTCALTSGGAVWCWGGNSDFQCGRTQPERLLGPARVPGIDDAVQITTGYQHTCALARDGQIRCWGNNFSGQLGNGTRDRSAQPVSVELP